MPQVKVVGYLRVSTVEQVSGFGLDVQEAAIREHCRLHRLRLVAVLRDEGQSGSNGLDTREASPAPLCGLRPAKPKDSSSTGSTASLATCSCRRR